MFKNLIAMSSGLVFGVGTFIFIAPILLDAGVDFPKVVVASLAGSLTTTFAVTYRLHTLLCPDAN